MSKTAKCKSLNGTVKDINKLSWNDDNYNTIKFIDKSHDL